MSEKTAGYAATPHRLGPNNLWFKPGFKLPNYIENVAKGLMESGHSRGEAIPMAIGVVRRWAAGGGNVHPEVRAASAAAIAEWEALKARAKSVKSTRHFKGAADSSRVDLAATAGHRVTGTRGASTQVDSVRASEVVSRLRPDEARRPVPRTQRNGQAQSAVQGVRAGSATGNQPRVPAARTQRQGPANGAARPEVVRSVPAAAAPRGVLGGSPGQARPSGPVQGVRATQQPGQDASATRGKPGAVPARGARSAPGATVRRDAGVAGGSDRRAGQPVPNMRGGVRASADQAAPPSGTRGGSLSRVQGATGRDLSQLQHDARRRAGQPGDVGGAGRVSAPVQLAAVNGHHVPGSEYHWFHEWRPRDVATAMVYGKTPPHRAKARDLRKVSGPTLQHRMEQSVNKGKFDVFDRLAGESDRRDTARAAARTAKQEKAAAVEQRRAEHLDRLMSEGHDHESAVEKAYGIPVQKQRDQNALAQLRASGHDGAGLTAAARKAHTAETHSRYVAAEEATNGHMLNAAGKAAKVNPKSLFTGPESRARKYASPELAEFFDQHGRPSFDEYLAEVRGHMQSASRMRSGRSDFHASAGDRTRVDLAWDPSKHPRVASGAGGGEFTSAQQSAGGKPRDAKAAEAQKDTDAKGQFDQLKAMDTAKQRAYLATLTPAQRQALTAFAYSAKTSDPKIVAARIALANANARAGKAGARKPRTVTARQPSTVTARKPRTVQASAAVRPRLDLAATVPGPAARKRMAADGVALPDGSYPCPDKAALSNAIQAYGRAPAAKRPKVVAHIRKHARRLGAMGDPKVQNFLSAHSSGS